MTGEPLPYIMRNDWLVTTILFLCLLGVLFIFSKGRKFLLKQTNGILVNKERSNLFDEATSSDTQYAFFLVSHACIMLVFCLYSFFAKSSPVLFDRFSHFELLAFSAGCVVALFLLKWSAYSFVNWIFFEEARNRLWIQFYFNIFIWMGLLLLPIVLLVVYFNLSLHFSLYLFVGVYLFVKIIMFWRCFNNFFNYFYGTFHLILYLCTLEILPDVLLWKIITLANNFFIQQ